jgi:hypothetical protein
MYEMYEELEIQFKIKNHTGGKVHVCCRGTNYFCINITDFGHFEWREVLIKGILSQKIQLTSAFEEILYK